MKIIVGLGNPGVEYQLTRHNAGQLLVDRIYHSQISIFRDSYGWRRKKNILVAEFPNLLLVKTSGVFMNESAKIVNQLTSLPVFQLENLYIAHDDLDIKLGEFKIQFGIGPKDHNGVKSVEQALGTKDFWRIRIGIDNRKNSNSNIQYSISGEEYVLKRFLSDERELIDQVLAKVAAELIS